MYKANELAEKLNKNDPVMAAAVQKYMDYVHNDYYRLALGLSDQNGPTFQVRAVLGGKNIRIYTFYKYLRSENGMKLHSVIRRRGRRGDIVAVTKKGGVSRHVVGTLMSYGQDWKNKVTWSPLVR